MPPAHDARGIAPLRIGLERARLLQEPPAVQAVAGQNDETGLHSRRQDRERFLDGPRSAFFPWASESRSKSQPIAAMPVTSPDTQRRIGP
jgi:hypothetical protein